MTSRGVVARVVFISACVLSATVFAQTSSLEGNVIGANARPLKNAEVRFEQKARQISPTISRTDANGHYTAVLSTGVYKMNLTERGR
jgi:hypothetical protein